MTELALIIEDDDDLAYIFAEALQAADYETKIYSDGEAAQQGLMEQIPNIILLDMHLPRIGGLEILNQIKNNPRFKKTTVIIATADARIAESQIDMADFVLIKPIAFSQLRDLTKRLHQSK
ncbi:MAG: response regulator [Chloroflexota bacterium]